MRRERHERRELEPLLPEEDRAADAVENVQLSAAAESHRRRFLAVILVVYAVVLYVDSSSRPAETEVAEPEAPREAEVTDLMAQLKASLGAGGGKPAERRKTTSRASATKKRGAGRASSRKKSA